MKKILERKFEFISKNSQRKGKKNVLELILAKSFEIIIEFKNENWFTYYLFNVYILV